MPWLPGKKMSVTTVTMETIFKVVGLKNLYNTKKHSGRCFLIYLAFAHHLIYHLNKYNINVCKWYTIQ